MLKSLKISNYILIEEAEINLEQGLNVFSGETGAGKSVILESVNTALGGKVRQGMLLDPQKEARIEISFSIEKVNDDLAHIINDIDLDEAENEIFITKIITPSLKAKTYLNGIRTTNIMMKKLRSILLDFHSQRDQQKLFDQQYQLTLIDAYGNLQNTVEGFTKKYYDYDKKLKQYKKLLLEEKENNERIELYKYQLEELEKAQLLDNEDAELTEEQNLLNHATELIDLKETFNREAFQNENSLFDQINSHIAEMNEYEVDSKYIKKAVSLLHDCLANLESAAAELEELNASIDLDPQRLESVNERLDLINSLKMKYHKNWQEIIAYKIEIKEFLSSCDNQKEKLKLMESELDKDFKDLIIQAQKLSAKRKKTADTFCKELTKSMKSLAMPAARIDIRFTQAINGNKAEFSQLQSNGQDTVDIYFSANLGKELQPLRIAASGGELSRFLLAIKKLLANLLPSRTIFFDEIDTGIGGKTAEITGRFISDTARHHQVVCITHLAQIGAFADNHLSIIKSNQNNKSFIEVKKLDIKNRVSEIARMLSGSDTDLALEHAEELLIKSGKQNV